MSDPERLANTLYSTKLISSSVKDEVVTTPGLSRYRKASIVVSDVERNMSGTDEMEKFRRLCEVMKAQHDQPLCEIVIKMKKEFDSSYDQRRNCESYWLNPLGSYNIEIKCVKLVNWFVLNNA